MDDYDLALYVDPDNFYGYYNRGLLRMQLGDDNRAIEDFDKVLDIDPDNAMARFNRSILKSNTGDYEGAIEDITRVLEDFPNFEYGYHCRAEARRKIGDKKGAEADDMWLLQYHLKSGLGQATADTDTLPDNSEKVRRRSDRNVKNYNKMVVADDEPGRQYVTAYRGKVQNRNVEIELLPMFAVTYYERPREFSNYIHYYKPINDLVQSGMLLQSVLLTNDERALSSNEVDRHFTGIDINSKNIAEFPDVLSYRLARALDFYLVQDFTASLNDLDAALTLEGDMWLVYFIRATVRAKLLESQSVNRVAADGTYVVASENALPNIDYRIARNDLDMVIAEMPDFAYAYYNRANVSAKLSDFKSAVVDYTKAIELDDKLAEAYYNRGLAKIYLGQTLDGIADLGKAGELGIYSAYNVIKRFSGQE
jgi:tetratricopeptide (TPR) repeat protein